jgi:pimeloyl-ACP methyl ester carboxylesterase
MVIEDTPGTEPVEPVGEPVETVESLGGRLVHWMRRGSGRPPVVLIGGCGVPSSAWDRLLPALGQLEVVQFDRPGLRGTPWPGVLPSLDAEVATLAALIERVDGPVVLVAHSMGGLHAEALVRSRPELVRGLVLAESSAEWRPFRAAGWLTRFAERCWLLLARSARACFRLPPLRILGSGADRLLVTAQSSRKLLDRRSPDAWSAYRSGDAVASVIAEQAAYGRQVRDLAELRTRTSFPDVPVVVVTAARAGLGRGARNQARLAELLGGRQLLTPEGRHMIMIDQPELLADAVREVAGLRFDG